MCRGTIGFDFNNIISTWLQIENKDLRYNIII